MTLPALDDTPRDAEVITLDDEDPVLCQWCDEPGRYRTGELGPLCDDCAPMDDDGPGLLMRDRLMAQGL